MNEHEYLLEYPYNYGHAAKFYSAAINNVLRLLKSLCLKIHHE